MRLTMSILNADADAKADSGHNTFTNGNNININMSDNSASYFAMTLSTLTMLEALKGNQNSDHIDSLVSKLLNTLIGLVQVENGNRDAILEAIKSLKKE